MATPTTEVRETYDSARGAGSVTFEPWPKPPHLTGGTDAVRFGPQTATIVDGVMTPIVLPDLPAGFGWQVSVFIQGVRKADVFYIVGQISTLPDVTGGHIDLGLVPRVDKATLQPTDDVVAAWQAIADGLVAEVTRAEAAEATKAPQATTYTKTETDTAILHAKPMKTARPVTQIAGVTDSAKSRFALLDGTSDWRVFGVNIGTNAAAGVGFRSWWGADWTNQWIDENMALASKLGVNTVRITGCGGGYADNPVTYKARMAYVIEKARQYDLKVIFTLLSAAFAPDEDFGSATAPYTAYKAMIDDLVTPYVNDPVILAWDALQDGRFATDTGTRNIAVALVPYIKTKDPSHMVTASGVDLTSATEATVLAVIDFISVNFYPGLTQAETSLQATVFGATRAAAPKPVLISEYGINNRTDQPSYGIATGNSAEAAWYINRAKVIALGSGLMGVCLHKLRDPANQTDGAWFGLYQYDQTPRPAAVHAAGFPDRRHSAITEHLRSRNIVVVTDNFSRVDSATTPGTSPMGGAPTARNASTWGISSKRLYLVTSATGTYPITWDVNAADVEVDASFGGPAIAGGILLRWTDDNNYIMCRFGSADATGGTPGVSLYSRASGTSTLLGTVVPVTQASFARLTAEVYDTTVNIYIDGRQVIRNTALPSVHTNATKHGVFIRKPDDGGAGTTFRHIAIAPINRTF